MSEPKLLIVDPSMGCAEDQGAAVVASVWPGPTRVLCPALREADVLTANSPRSGFDALVILGSKASAVDDLPWLRGLGAWADPILSGEAVVPTLGICFGHQFIAQRAGGQVGFLRPDESKLVAYVSSELAPSRLNTKPSSVRVIASHRETVTAVPPHYRSVGQREEVLHDVLEHESLPIFSAQFHPEAREQFAARAGLPTGGVDDQLRRDTLRYLRAFVDQALAGVRSA